MYKMCVYMSDVQYCLHQSYDYSGLSCSISNALELTLYLEDPSLGVLGQYKGHPFNYVLG